MSKEIFDFEMMARKLWCDVYIALIVSSTSQQSGAVADVAYEKFKREFDPINAQQNRDEKGRFAK